MLLKQFNIYLQILTILILLSIRNSVPKVSKISITKLSVLQKRCCGVSNYTDWNGIIDPDYPSTLPDSCCDGPNCGIQGATVAYDVVGYF